MVAIVDIRDELLDSRVGSDLGWGLRSWTRVTGFGTPYGSVQVMVTVWTRGEYPRLQSR